MPGRAALVLLALSVTACAELPPSSAPASATPRAGHAAASSSLAWSDLTPATFARAKTERRYVVLDGAAEWCHFCHVMEAMTYGDREVADLLAARFIAVKVDVDARPDVEERYGAYGWPATVIFSPDGEELGKYRGYIPKDRFLGILREVLAADASRASSTSSSEAEAGPVTPLPESQLDWIQRMTALDLEDYWDAREGGWGSKQKAAIAGNNGYALLRAKAGDAKLGDHAEIALDKQRALFDPVWGGIYQYSAASDWNSPHFEKLMTYQAGALGNYAEAYLATREDRWLEAVRSLRGYVERWLVSPEGGFYTTQDADLNAHEANLPFTDGHTYYALDEAHRLALGVPRIDKHEYGKENGLAIAAYARVYEATKDEGAKALAKRAAARILATHGSPLGGITHDVATAPGQKVLFLSDNAAFGFGLLALYDATHAPELLAGAERIAAFLHAELADERGGGFFAGTKDPDAAGVFARRRKPFDENVMAVRFLARLEGRTADAEVKERCRVEVGKALAAITTPEAIKGRGRMLGEFLLALEESRGAR